jgi:hypothetical protein
MKDEGRQMKVKTNILDKRKNKTENPPEDELPEGGGTVI